MKTTKTGIEITEIVKRHGGSQSVFASNPTWFDKYKQEGFDIMVGTLRPFFINGVGRVYGQPVGELWQKVIDEVINGKEDKKPEQVPAAAAVGAKPVKKCLCGAAIAENYIRCKSCDEKLKSRAGEDKQLLVLEHINWNLGLISQYFAWQMQQVQNKEKKI